MAWCRRTTLDLYLLTDDVEDRPPGDHPFWSNFDSLRYVGDRLVIRLRHEPTPAELVALNERFGWLCRRGEITVSEPLSAEVADDDRLDRPRLVLRLEFRQVGRLRILVNALNDLPSASGSGKEYGNGSLMVRHYRACHAGRRQLLRHRAHGRRRQRRTGPHRLAATATTT